MEKICQENVSQNRKTFLYKNGKIYFSKKTERKLFFILTLIMLLSGIISKLGFF